LPTVQALARDLGWKLTHTVDGDQVVFRLGPAQARRAPHVLGA
jgi:hypothetical protein